MVATRYVFCQLVGTTHNPLHTGEARMIFKVASATMAKGTGIHGCIGLPSFESSQEDSLIITRTFNGSIDIRLRSLDGTL